MFSVLCCSLLLGFISCWPEWGMCLSHSPCSPHLGFIHSWPDWGPHYNHTHHALVLSVLGLSEGWTLVLSVLGLSEGWTLVLWVLGLSEGWTLVLSVLGLSDCMFVSLCWLYFCLFPCCTVVCATKRWPGQYWLYFCLFPCCTVVCLMWFYEYLAWVRAELWFYQYLAWVRAELWFYQYLAWVRAELWFYQYLAWVMVKAVLTTLRTLPFSWHMLTWHLEKKSDVQTDITKTPWI